MSDKRYDQFSSGTPTASNITLFADPSTGALNKCTLPELFAVGLNPGSLLNMVQTLGSPIKSFNLNIQHFNAYNRMFLFQNATYYWLNYLPACTVTGAWYSFDIANNVTNTGFAGFALYSISGTTCTQVAITANTPSFFTGTLNSFRQAAFTSATAIPAGVYYLVMQCPSSAQVQRCMLYANAWYNNAFTTGLGMPSGFVTSGQSNAYVTLPGTFATSTITGTQDPVAFMGLY